MCDPLWKVVDALDLQWQHILLILSRNVIHFKKCTIWFIFC